MKVLVVEDDESLCTSLTYLFTQKGISVTCINNGKDGLTEAYKSYDVLLIDCMLPDLPGISIIEKIRKDNVDTPVIIISALNDLDNKLKGFKSGTDDYIVKPFDFDELYVRIISLLKRSGRLQERIISFGDLSYDSERYKIFTSEKEAGLSKTESLIMEYLLKNLDTVCKSDDIINAVWGTDAFMSDNNLANFIYFLRKKIKSIDSSVKIKNIHGIGYKLIYPEAGKDIP